MTGDDVLTFSPCKVGHLALIEPPEGAAPTAFIYNAPEFSDLIERSIAVSAWCGSRCLGAAGIVQTQPQKAIAWSLLSAKSGRHMFAITRKVLEVLDAHKHLRVEMFVDYDFAIGHRWARMLGFEVEAERMRKAGYFGQDQTLYARVF